MEKFRYYSTHYLGDYAFSKSEFLGIYSEVPVKVKPEAADIILEDQKLNCRLPRTYMLSEWGGEYGPNFFLNPKEAVRETVVSYVEGLHFFAWDIPNNPAESRVWAECEDPVLVDLCFSGSINLGREFGYGSPRQTVSVSSFFLFNIFAEMGLLIKPVRFFDTFLKPKA